MEQELEELLGNLLGTTFDTVNKYNNLEQTLAQLKNSLFLTGLTLHMSEDRIEEWFKQYSAAVGEIVGSDRPVELVLARTREEWADENILKLSQEYPDILIPYLPLIKAAVMGELTTQNLEAGIADDPAATICYIQGLPADAAAMFEFNGVSFDEKVVIDFLGVDREIYSVLYMTAEQQGLVTSTLRDAVQADSNGSVKYVIAHEATHAHLPEIREMMLPLSRSLRKFTIDLFNLIYDLGEENEQIMGAIYNGAPARHSKEVYATGVYAHAINKFNGKMFSLMQPDDFKPLPLHIREFMASFRDVPTKFVATAIDESLGDFVAELVLKGDGEYDAFAARYNQQIQASVADSPLGFEMNARKAGLPFIRALYAKHGNEIFDMLKQNLPQTQEELAKPELYLKRAGFNS